MCAFVAMLDVCVLYVSFRCVVKDSIVLSICICNLVLYSVGLMLISSKLFCHG